MKDFTTGVFVGLMLSAALVWAGIFIAWVKRPEIRPYIPPPLPSGPKLFRREPEKKAPKVQDDQKAWLAENR